MAAYFRSMFGGHTSNTSHSESKSHKRSQSAPTTSAYNPQNLNYIYAAPPGVTSSTTSSRAERDRTCSHAARTNAPSPLRYAAYDSGSVRSKAHSVHPSAVPYTPSTASQPAPQHQKPVRVPMYRTTSNIPGDRHAMPYPIYSHDASLSSVHSTSSSSMHPGSSVSGHRPPFPRSSSSGSVPSEARSALKQSSTWNSSTKSTGPHPHVSFMNPKRTSALHMHPLFAYSRLYRPPISYDVLYTPSSRTVVDRSTRSAIPAHTLAQPATDPPTLGRLVLKSSKFPWPIVVSSTSSGSSKSGSRFYLAGSSSSASGSAGTPVTNLDVLYALHNTLQVRVTQQEWEALGHGSRAQRKVTQAYEKRCITLGGGWDGGVRRIDFLGEKTRLAGVEVDKTADGGVGKLVFSHA